MRLFKRLRRCVGPELRPGRGFRSRLAAAMPEASDGAVAAGGPL